MILLATAMPVVILACMHYGLALSPRSASAWPVHTPAQGAYLLPPICLCSWLEMARTIPFIDPLVRILCGIIDIRIRRSGIVGGADSTLVWSFSPMLVVQSCSVPRRQKKLHDSDELNLEKKKRKTTEAAACRNGRRRQEGNAIMP